MKIRHRRAAIVNELRMDKPAIKTDNTIVMMKKLLIFKLAIDKQIHSQ